MTVQVMAAVWESDVPAPERFTLLALADRANEVGYCWPSVPTLARKCRTSERTIRRHLDTLRGYGVLAIDYDRERAPGEYGTGERQRSNGYTIRLDVLAAYVHPGQSGRGDNLTGVPPADCQGYPRQIDRGTPVRLTADTSVDPTGDPTVDPTPSPLRGEDVTTGQPSLDGMPDPEPAETAPADEYEAEPGFAQWWAAYPRKVDKRKALRAYRAARKRGVGIDRLHDGARRYAAERQGQDVQYTKHPTSWLNADAHANEATPAPSRTSSTMGPAPVGAAGKFDDMADDEVYLRNPPPGFVWRDHAGEDAPNGGYVSPTCAARLDSNREDRSPR